jgi:hypothetical protein
MLRHILLLSVLSVSALALASSNIRGSANQTFREVELLSEKDVDDALDRETASNADTSRLAELETLLLPMYEALPKRNGQLGSKTLRYLLQRFFLNQRGWLVKGLEPIGNAWEFQSESNKQALKGWIPAHMQARMEKHLNHASFELRDVAAIIAAIEDLVNQEAELQLKQVFASLGFDSSQPLSATQAAEVMDMYLMLYVTARNLTIANPERQRKRLSIFAAKYSGFKEVHAWLEKVEGIRLTQDSTKSLDLLSLKGIVKDFGEQYADFNDLECKDLKSTLISMEGGSRKPGRIPLTDFYKKTRHTHWKFTESPEYLRALGALDESDPVRPHVIVSNYVTSFNNCLQATGIYSVCCRTECEQLMRKIEQNISSPSATPERIAAVVGTFSTDTVQLQGSLGQKELRRLQDIANANGGNVNLHGRLFAQWMHHVFPRECPYPHEAGSTKPQTTDDWIKNTGRGVAVSDAEIQEIEDKTCPAFSVLANGDATKGCSEEEDVELPWTDVEELLDHDVTQLISRTPSVKDDAQMQYLLVIPCLVTTGVALVLLDRKCSSIGSDMQARFRLCVVVLGITSLALALDLVNKFMLVGAGVLYLLSRVLTDHCLNIAPPTASDKLDKCCV